MEPAKGDWQLPGPDFPDQGQIICGGILGGRVAAARYQYGMETDELDPPRGTLCLAEATVPITSVPKTSVPKTTVPKTLNCTQDNSTLPKATMYRGDP